MVAVKAGRRSVINWKTNFNCLATFAVSCGMSASSSAMTNPGAADYPSCAGKHFPSATRAELKSSIAKTLWPWVVPASVDRFFAEHSVIVASAKLRRGHSDLIAYASGRSICGSGGCKAYVFEERSRSALDHPNYVLLTKIVPARLPISALPTIHNGWRDIGVNVAGGGIVNGYTAALSYDGKSYDSNPTLPNVPKAKVRLGEVLLGPPGASNNQCRLR